MLGALGKGIDDRQMRHVFGVATVYGGDVLEGVEIIAPGIGHAARVGQVVLVHLFDIRRVAAEEVGGGLVGTIVRANIASGLATGSGGDLTHDDADLCSPVENFSGG